MEKNKNYVGFFILFLISVMFVAFLFYTGKQTRGPRRAGLLFGGFVVYFGLAAIIVWSGPDGPKPKQAEDSRAISSRIVIPSKYVTEIRKYLKSKTEIGGVFQIKNNKVQSVVKIPGEKGTFQFNDPGWASTNVYHTHPLSSYYLPSANDYVDMLTNLVERNYFINYDTDPAANICRDQNQTCHYNNTTCRSYNGRSIEMVFAPNGVYMYYPSKTLINKFVKYINIPDDTYYDKVDELTKSLGPYDGKHMHPWSNGEGNYNSSIVGTIQPFSNEDGKKLTIPISATKVKNHSKYIKFMKSKGFIVKFTPYSDDIVLPSFVGKNINDKIDQLKPLCS